jgi:hypothetical protein
MAINIKVHEALQQIVANSDAVIDADLNFFCPEATHASERVSSIKQLVYSFGSEEDPKLQKISLNNYLIHSHPFRLHLAHVAGVLLFDLIRYSWHGVLSKQEEQVNFNISHYVGHH